MLAEVDKGYEGSGFMDHLRPFAREFPVYIGPTKIRIIKGHSLFTWKVEPVCVRICKLRLE